MRKIEFDPFIAKEIFESKQYDLFVTPEKNDLYLDLGCSQGFNYFLHQDKNLKFIGIDACVDCLEDFSQGLEISDDCTLLNLFVSDQTRVITDLVYHNGESIRVKVPTITWKNLLNLINKPIDFLKFDIESWEKCLWYDNENFDLFKKYVHKFTGEVHFTSLINNKKNMFYCLNKLYNDKSIELKLFSVDCIDITKNFWNHQDYYSEILIAGFVKKEEIIIQQKQNTKILFVMPHASTGGQPQYLLKILKSLDKNINPYVVEYSFVSPDYVVQRNEIKKTISINNFFSLSNNKTELLDIINKINPDIIHFQEIPEMFLDETIANKIYLNPDRKYKIIETTHTSDFDIFNKKFFPDKFIFVCPFSQIQYAHLGIPSEIIEFPAEKVKPANKKEFWTNKGFSSDAKHVVIVGLFTPRKNQAYAFRIASQLSDQNIVFHFLGNQAPNFQKYWGPLMENKPKNCVIWGERTNVQEFLNSADLMLFPSFGRTGDKELNPLCIKEALSANIPILMFNLDVYLKRYDSEPDVHFLTGNETNDSNLLQNILQKEKPQNYLFNIATNPQESKIIITYKGKEKINIIIGIRELNSEIPIYFCEKNLCGGEGCWIQPVGSFNLWDDNFCFGMIVEFYNLDTKEIIETQKIKIKERPLVDNSIKFPHLSPFDCLYINYREFFYLDVYKNLEFPELDTVIDIGANVGLFSEYILNKGVKKLYAVEPCSRAFDNLNAQFYNRNNVVLIKKAIDSTVGERLLYTPEDNTTISTLEMVNGDPGFTRRQITSETVETITVPKLLEDNGLTKVSLLKMDIEGAEYNVFESLSADDFEKITSFLIEFHHNKDGKLKKILDKLNKYGYNYSLYKQSTSIPTTETNPSGILFAKKNS